MEKPITHLVRIWYETSINRLVELRVSYGKTITHLVGSWFPMEQPYPIWLGYALSMEKPVTYVVGLWVLYVKNP